MVSDCGWVRTIGNGRSKPLPYGRVGAHHLTPITYHHSIFLPISTPMTDAIIKPLVQPELSPRQ